MTALYFFIGAAGLFLLAVVVIAALAFLISPTWFSRAFASMVGGFAGVSAAMVAVLALLCACSGVGIAAILFLISQAYLVG